MERGVEHGLARQVAEQLMAKDALGAHARDELGISEFTTARPIQAAWTSAATFALGAAMPLAMVLLMPRSFLVAGVSIASLIFLALLGAIGARAGGANVARATLRVTRSEENTSELQSLMRISYAVFCLQKKKSKTAEHKNESKEQMSKQNKVHQ